MKKFAIIAATALLCLSCTVEKINTSRRTPEYLAALASDVIGGGCDENAGILASCIKHPKVHSAMWTYGWDSLVTASSGRKIHIVKAVQDSVWTLTNATDGDIFSFSATMKARKDSLNGQMTWLYNAEGVYNEHNGYCTNFETAEEGVVFSWFQYVSIYEVTYYLVKTGMIETTMFKDDEEIDWAKIVYNGGLNDYEYITSQNQK